MYYSFFDRFILQGNDVSAKQAKELSELLSLPHMRNLKELCLDDNEIESDGAICIAKGVKVNHIDLIYLCNLCVLLNAHYTQIPHTYH